MGEDIGVGDAAAKSYSRAFDDGLAAWKMLVVKEAE